MRGIGCEPAGLGNFPWGHLGAPLIQGNEVAIHGQAGYMGFHDYHGHDYYMGADPTDISTDDFGAAGGLLAPSAPPVTVGQVATYLNTGQGDPSWISQLGDLISTAGPAINQIMEQYQFGTLAANTPIASLPALRAAVTGAPVSASSIVSSLTNNPTFLLLGAGVLVFLLMKRK